MPASNTLQNAPLQGKDLLAPIQRSFLSAFSQIKDQTQFYLTGGTALAEYYLGHRISLDLDFFTSVEDLILPVSYQLEKLSSPTLQVTVIRRFATYVEFLVSDHQENLKVDLALDSPFRFEQPILTREGIWVNDYQDLRVDKLLAYYGRAEPRDAVDLFIILQNEPIEPLLTQSSQKDPGFDLYWFAIALNKSANFPDESERWPVKMLVPFDPREIKRSFQARALEIMSDLRKSN